MVIDSLVQAREFAINRTLESFAKNYVSAADDLKRKQRTTNCVFDFINSLELSDGLRYIKQYYSLIREYEAKE